MAEISRMFAQSKQDMFDGNVIQNPLKVRPCFVRVLRDKDLDDHIKRYKKNDTEVNRYKLYSRFFKCLFCLLKSLLMRVATDIAANDSRLTNISGCLDTSKISTAK